MGERNSEYARDEHDWYVEPEWCVSTLMALEQFTGGVHDPCCGMGTIPNTHNAITLPYYHPTQGQTAATGADLVDRGYGFPQRDFLKDRTKYDNIITNPPYKIAAAVIDHALKHVLFKVAALVQLKFLAAQRRYSLFQNAPTSAVYIFSRRPSMPPGEMLKAEGEACRGGGSIDYCWVVWDRVNPPPSPVIRWIK